MQKIWENCNISILSVTSHFACWPDNTTVVVVIRSTWRCTFFNDVDDVAWRCIDAKIDNYVSLKIEPIGKLLNRTLGLRLLISSLPGSALKTHEASAEPRDLTSVLKVLLDRLDIKRHPLSILYVSAEPRDSTSVLKALPVKLDIKILYVSA